MIAKHSINDMTADGSGHHHAGAKDDRMVLIRIPAMMKIDRIGLDLIEWNLDERNSLGQGNAFIQSAAENYVFDAQVRIGSFTITTKLIDYLAIVFMICRPITNAANVNLIACG